MAIIFDDRLESYAIGADPPTGWLDIGFFKGQIVANQLNRNEGSRVYQFSGAGGDIIFAGTTTPATTVNWIGVNSPNLRIGNSTDTGIGQALAFAQVELDKTLSLYITSTATGGLFQGAALIANSVTPVVNRDVWNYYQISFQLSNALFVQGTTTHTYVAVAGTGWVDGTQVCSGAGTTTLSAVNLPVPGLFLNRWEFLGGGGNANTCLDDLWATDSVLSTWTAPHPGSPSARVTQAVAEVIKRPSAPAARVTQGVSEIVKLPASTARNARVTQGVVEIIVRNQPSGWIVYEA